MSNVTVEAPILPSRATSRPVQMAGPSGTTSPSSAPWTDNRVGDEGAGGLPVVAAELLAGRSGSRHATAPARIVRAAAIITRRRRATRHNISETELGTLRSRTAFGHRAAMADEEDLRLAVLDAIRTTWRSMGISNHSVSTLLEDVSFAVEVKADCLGAHLRQHG
jgi:hypothetical protein